MGVFPGPIYFYLKMHQKAFGGRAHPLVELLRSPRLLSHNEGPTSKGERGEEMEGNGKGKVKGRQLFIYTHFRDTPVGLCPCIPTGGLAPDPQFLPPYLQILVTPLFAILLQVCTVSTGTSKMSDVDGHITC